MQREQLGEMLVDAFVIGSFLAAVWVWASVGGGAI